LSTLNSSLYKENNLSSLSEVIRVGLGVGVGFFVGVGVGVSVITIYSKVERFCVLLILVENIVGIISTLFILVDCISISLPVIFPEIDNW